MSAVDDSGQTSAPPPGETTHWTGRMLAKAAASLDVTSGPSPATLAPRVTAKSQSTIFVMLRP